MLTVTVFSVRFQTYRERGDENLVSRIKLVYFMTIHTARLFRAMFGFFPKYCSREYRS